MTRFVRYGAPLAAVVFAGCAGMGGRGSDASANPSAQKVATPQQQSQQALEHASDVQKKANEQAKRAAEAQQDVQKKQQELQATQQRARQEQEKAQQLQLQANRETEQATQQAQRSQQQASRALAQQSQQVQRGQQQIQGQVQQSTGQQLVVQPQSGTNPLTLQITGDTQIRIDGRQASASEIQPGENALVSYEVSGTQPTARSVQIVTGRIGSQGSTAQPDTSSTGTPGNPSTSDPGVSQPQTR